MNRLSKLCFLLFLLSFSTFSDVFGQISVRIGYPPPPPPVRVERPRCPGPDYNWVEGYWAWDDYVRDYVWHRGFWEYVQPRCSKKGRGHHKDRWHHKHRRNRDRDDDDDDD